MKGEEAEIINFLEWFRDQPFAYKILIAGNHDFYFEREPEEQINKIFPPGVIYLRDSGITINKLKIWGSPATPWFFDWAFNRHRGEPIKRHWDLIPADTDVLITHGPVYRTLDTNTKGGHVGCKDLFDTVHEIKPKAHICGHIHEAYGTVDESGIRFINASVPDEKYELKNSPVVFDLGWPE